MLLLRLLGLLYICLLLRLNGLLLLIILRLLRLLGLLLIYRLLIRCLIDLLRGVIALRLLRLLRLHRDLFTLGGSPDDSRGPGRRGGCSDAGHGVKTSLAMAMERHTMQDESSNVNDPINTTKTGGSSRNRTKYSESRIIVAVVTAIIENKSRLRGDEGERDKPEDNMEDV